MPVFGRFRPLQWPIRAGSMADCRRSPSIPYCRRSPSIPVPCRPLPSPAVVPCPLQWPSRAGLGLVACRPLQWPSLSPSMAVPAVVPAVPCRCSAVFLRCRLGPKDRCKALKRLIHPAKNTAKNISKTGVFLRSILGQSSVTSQSNPLILLD